MNKISNCISLDFNIRKYICVTAKQYDEVSRLLVISLYDNETAYHIDSDVEVKLRCTKADNTCVLYDIPKECISGNIINLTLPQSVLTVSGEVICDICFFRQTNTSGIMTRQVLSTPLFYLQIEKAGYNEKAVLSSNDYSALNKATDDCKYQTDLCVYETNRIVTEFLNTKASIQNMINQNTLLTTELSSLKTSLSNTKIEFIDLKNELIILKTELETLLKS